MKDGLDLFIRSLIDSSLEKGMEEVKARAMDGATKALNVARKTVILHQLISAFSLVCAMSLFGTGWFLADSYFRTRSFEISGGLIYCSSALVLSALTLFIATRESLWLRYSGLRRRNPGQMDPQELERMIQQAIDRKFAEEKSKRSTTDVA